MKFNAKALLLYKENNEWKERNVTIKSVSDIRTIFKPYDSVVEQVDLDRYRKIYYCLEFIKDGIDAKVIDMNDNKAYMVAPLPLVQCDYDKPIDITEEIAQSIKSAIDFC